MPISMTESLTYLTADLPGISGTIKQCPEDFLVEEQPLYEPSGDGEHLLLYIEKRGQTTSDVIRRVAKIFHVSRKDIGYAGLKDKHAITRQHLSVHLPDASKEKFLSRFEFTPFNLLWARRHHSKLRRGHLSGNRFTIYVRAVEPDAIARAEAVLDHLLRTGVPNYVGRQRFGYRQSNHEWGRLLLLRQWRQMLDAMLGGPRQTDGPPMRAGREAYDRGDYRAALEAWPKQLRHDRQALDALRQGKSAFEAVMAIDAQQREFMISALQSAMFNVVLDKRVRDGLLVKLLPGDLAWKHDSGSVFAVDQAAADADNAPRGRVEQVLVSPSGPMWGADMLKPSGQMLESETQVLAQNGITQTDLEQADHLCAPGSRRSMRMVLRDCDVSAGTDEHRPYLRLVFELARGSFATVVLREIMKNDAETFVRASDVRNS